VASVKTGNFTTSVVTTLDSWRVFVEHDPELVTLLTEAELGRLTAVGRLAYEDERSDYHAALPALKAPILDRTVTKGLLFMRLNRGQQLGTSCGMILSGVPGVGKTTAIRALGRTVEKAYRARNPQMTDAVPVVYITMPTAQHPKALPAELLYFLEAPHAARATETALAHQACQLMIDLRTSLVIVDEVHEIDRSRASHDQQSDQLKVLQSRTDGPLAAARPHRRCSPRPQHLAAPRVGGASRVHGTGGCLRQSLLGRARRTYARPATPALLLAPALGIHDRQGLSPPDDEDLRPPSARHPRTGPLGPPAE
jgi:Bacterial TniB protein